MDSNANVVVTSSHSVSPKRVKGLKSLGSFFRFKSSSSSSSMIEKGPGSVDNVNITIDIDNKIGDDDDNNNDDDAMIHDNTNDDDDNDDDEFLDAIESHHHHYHHSKQTRKNIYDLNRGYFSGWDRELNYLQSLEEGYARAEMFNNNNNTNDTATNDSNTASFGGNKLPREGTSNSNNNDDNKDNNDEKTIVGSILSVLSLVLFTITTFISGIRKFFREASYKKLVKYSIIGISVDTLVALAAMIAAAYALSEVKWIPSITKLKIWSSVVVIFLSAASIVLNFAGFIGSYVKNRQLLAMYFIFLVLRILLFSIMAIVAFCYAYAPSITKLTDQALVSAFSNEDARLSAKKFLIGYDVIIGAGCVFAAVIAIIPAVFTVHLINSLKKLPTSHLLGNTNTNTNTNTIIHINYYN